MKESREKIVKLAIAYLESFVDCEESNTKNCTDCGLSQSAADLVDFTEAKYALKILKAEFED